tara:strand:- start:2414 stop:3679 length:1266 start_codon:yes stop_codon:yes gene_type:complete
MNQKLNEIMNKIGSQAQVSYKSLAKANTSQKNEALELIAQQIDLNYKQILNENQKDIEIAISNKKSEAIIDRLTLNEDAIKGISDSIRKIIEIDDPVGKTISSWERPNGLRIKRISIPIGVIGIIYESRPNVTADAAALCLKSGNASILRSGSDSFNSSYAIYKAIKTGLTSSDLDNKAIQFIPTKDREAVGLMLNGLNSNIDIIVPRGGKSLVSRVKDDARIPVFGHLEGICHVYINKSAKLKNAINITANAKMRRTAICGAAETLLIDKEVAKKYLPKICEKLIGLGCEIRGDKSVKELYSAAKLASESDWSKEYLDAIISVKIVKNIDEAIEHIEKYGTGHTEAIVAEDSTASNKFTQTLDSSIILVNASTQFADGGEFGFGAEIGISTGRLHARGPIGLEQLTTFKYTVEGNGQLRP